MPICCAEAKEQRQTCDQVSNNGQQQEPVVGPGKNHQSVNKVQPIKNKSHSMSVYSIEQWAQNSNTEPNSILIYAVERKESIIAVLSPAVSLLIP